jgi:hypothetical protein
MADLSRLYAALKAADAAGNTADATALAQAIKAGGPGAGQQPRDSGGLNAFVRGLANGATFNLADTIAAAGDATIPLDSGASTAPTWMGRFQENRARQKGQTDLDHANHATAALAGNIGGGFLNPVTRAIPLAKTPLGKVAQGGLLGGAYGLGGGISNQDDPSGLALDAAKGVGTGAALPALAPFAKGAANLAGKGATYALGLTTGVGPKAIQEAFAAGKSGGAAEAALKGAMRGDANWSDVVDDAKGALANLRANRNAAYRSGMIDVSKDPTILSFEPLDQALAKANAVKSYKGQDLDPATADVRSQINGVIDNWRNLDPAEYHTPEGFDALKQQIGSIKDNQPFNTPQRVVADTAYNAVRKTIAQQAPAYNEVMSGYSKASDLIDSIQRELSLGPKGNPGTALRKLQSVLRTDANSGWGGRSQAADVLANNGAPLLLPKLAGQALSQSLPRGLAGLTAGGELATAAGSAALGHPAVLLGMVPTLAASSPRLVGEGALLAGKGAALASQLARHIPTRNPSLMLVQPQGSGQGSPGLFGGALAALLANPTYGGAH